MDMFESSHSMLSTKYATIYTIPTPHFLEHEKPVILPLKILRTIAKCNSPIVLTSIIETRDVGLMLVALASGDINAAALFICACDLGFTEIVQRILKLPQEKRRIVDGIRALQAARFLGYGSVFGILLVEEDLAQIPLLETWALQRASLRGHTEIVRMLLELPLDRGVDPSANDNDAFIWACRNGHTKIARLLLDLPLERGVNPAANDNYPLETACTNGHTEIVRLLLDLPLNRGVNPSACNNDAIRTASINGHTNLYGYTEIVRLLLELPPERGVDPTAENNEALRFASRHGQTDIVRLLKAKIPWYRRIFH